MYLNSSEYYWNSEYFLSKLTIEIEISKCFIKFNCITRIPSHNKFCGIMWNFNNEYIKILNHVLHIISCLIWVSKISIVFGKFQPHGKNSHVDSGLVVVTLTQLLAWMQLK